eukprot:1099100-Pelagomonas_calceolata.AAC.3
MGMTSCPVSKCCNVELNCHKHGMQEGASRPKAERLLCMAMHDPYIVHVADVDCSKQWQTFVRR